MHPFLKRLYTQAKRAKALIVLAEAEDPRVVAAAAKIERLGLARLLLIGDQSKIAAIARRKKFALRSHIINPATYETNFASTLFELRKEKGMTLAQAKRLCLDPRYFAALLVHTGVADGFVSGNLSPTADTLRAALQVIGTPKGARAFSYFIMLDPKVAEPRFFADCGFNIAPDEQLLATIGVGTAREAASFGVKPRVAFLSYSTKGSAGGEGAERSRAAATLAKRRLRGVPVDGELQFDAAFVPTIGKSKAPTSAVAGKANVFVFPDLAAGNIGYKIAERIGGWQALGPIVSGLKSPANDLSRGCSVDDIVSVVAVTAAQSRGV